MAKPKTAPLDGNLIIRKGEAVPVSATAPAPPQTKDTIAVTVRLDKDLYLALKSYGVSFRPRKTNQEIIVGLLKEHLPK